MAWKKDIFNNFIKLNRGFDLPEKDIVAGEFPIVASTSIKAHHHTYKVEAPCVVTGRSGSLGAVQYVASKCWPLNTTLYVKDYKGNLPRFVYYFLVTMHLENFNSGAGVPTLNQNHLHKIKINIPPLPLQRKIATILSAYDDLIENNNRRIAILEKMAEEFYREWFVRLRFPGYENVKIVKGIPEGWEIKKVHDLGSVVTGKTPPTSNRRFFDGQYPFIKTPDMHNKLFLIHTEETLSQEGIQYQKAQTLPANSICVSCIGTGGIVAITSTVSQTNQQINSVILNQNYYREYAYFVLNGMKEMIYLFGYVGATMTNLSKGKFENLKFVMAPDNLLKEFHNKTSILFELILNIQKQTFRLSMIRNRLLSRLMSGKIDVENMDIELPASMKEELVHA